MTDQNHSDQSHPDQPRRDQPDDGSGQYQQDDPSQQGRALEDADGQPRYGVRLTPEQLAERQAQQPASGSHPHQPGSQYGQSGPSEYPPPSYGDSGQSPYGQPGQPAHPGEPASYPYGQPPAGYAQQPYPQQPYSQQPYGYPVQAQQPMGPVEKPKQIDRSYWLIVAAGVAFLVIELIAAFSPIPPELIESIESQFAAAGMTVDVASYLESGRVVFVVFTVIIAALYLLVATGIRRGSNVARIFGTIFAVMSLPAVFGISIIYVALGIAGIVFAYLRPSNEYFRGKAWERAMRR